MDNKINADIKLIKGVGESRAKLLNKLGIYTVWDMLWFFPRKLEDRTELKKIFEATDGETVCIKATVFSSVQIRPIRKGMKLYSLILRDDSGIMSAVWFNNKYVVDAFKLGETYTFYGKVEDKYGKKQLNNPIYDKIDSSVVMGRIVPIYPLTEGLSQKIIAKIGENCIKFLDSFPESLPSWIREEYHLAEIKYSIKNIHFPESYEAYNIARKRLSFEELLMLQIGLRSLSMHRNNKKGKPFKNTDVHELIASLPFSLTNAQKRVIEEIGGDLTKSRPMNRLIQGDVGSGKTIVAFCSLYMAVKNGFQAAMMAPTEILAAQHFRSLLTLMPDKKIAFLTGGSSAKEKKRILDDLALGEIDIIIGTHALIEETAVYKNLALVVTDEQHRFGVRQRGLLAAKGDSPHVLVMTATPIPRTLALILYGDLDVSVINELPPNRQIIDTFVVNEDMRQRIYAFIEKEVLNGRQTYIVCPAVENNDENELKSVIEFAQNLEKNVFPNIKVGFIHGKMKSKDKDLIMNSFINKEIKILVATTVIEVGVNVPNATLMVVENANRFGLSQLHQLRGRVGRGSHKSYCILFCESGNDIANKRMEITKSTNDGFKIAEKDLELRGPGEFFGTRQHGVPEMKIANMFSDFETLKSSGTVANQILEDDPQLLKNENKALKASLLKMFKDNGAEGMFN